MMPPMTPSDLVLTVRRPPGTAHIYRFSADEVRIGRDPACGVHLPDPTVSAVHLRIERHGDGYRVIDPGSTHGTRLGGRPLSPRTPTILEAGDALEVGPYLVEVYLDPGGGLSTELEDTARLALALATEHASGGGGFTLWALNGTAAGAAVPLGLGQTITVGRSAEADLQLTDAGVADTHLRLSLDRRGRAQIDAIEAVRVRGRTIKGPRSIAVGDHVLVGEALLTLRGPEPDAAPSWSPLEMAALAAIGLAVVAVGYAVWTLLF